MTELSIQSIQGATGIWALYALIAGSAAISLLRREPRFLAIAAMSVLAELFLDGYSLAFIALIGAIAYIVNGRYRGNAVVLRAFGWTIVALLILYKAVLTYSGLWSGVELITLMGVSYYTFKLASLSFEMARNPEMKIQTGRYVAWLFFVPTFFAGPIQRYSEFEETDCGFRGRVFKGVERISIGIIFKLLISDTVMSFLLNEFVRAGLSGKAGLLSVDLSLLLIGPAGLLRAFFDFAALSHIAIGVALLAGIVVPENFNRPLFATNISNFWKRWHMTLSRWSMDYVFTPVMLKTRSKVVAFYATFLFIGIWHSPEPTWIVWAVGHATGFVIFDYWKSHLSLKVRRRFNLRVPRHLSTVMALILTQGYISLVFVAIAGRGIEETLQIYRSIVRVLTGV